MFVQLNYWNLRQSVRNQCLMCTGRIRFRLLHMGLLYDIIFYQGNKCSTKSKFIEVKMEFVKKEGINELSNPGVVSRQLLNPDN